MTNHIQDASADLARRLSRLIDERKEQMLTAVIRQHSLASLGVDEMKRRLAIVTSGGKVAGEFERFWIELDGERVTATWAAGHSDDMTLLGVAPVGDGLETLGQRLSADALSLEMSRMTTARMQGEDEEVEKA